MYFWFEGFLSCVFVCYVSVCVSDWRVVFFCVVFLRRFGFSGF